MKSCPICHCDKTYATDSRGERRRRKCGRCGHRWTTFEINADRLEQLEAIERTVTELVSRIKDGASGLLS